MTMPLAIACFTLFGFVVGSLLNVCIDRLPAGESIVKPPSSCGSCRQRLKAKDLIPLFSYLWLRGRCRYCKVRIPIRILVVEIATAVIFALIAWNFMQAHQSLSAHILMPLIYACLFIVIFFIDLEHQIIINMTVYIGVILSLIFAFFWFPFFWPDFAIWPAQGILSALLGGAIGFAFLLLPNLITRGRGMGGGDVMLAVFIGTATGFPLVIAALFIGIFSGALVAITLLLLRLRKRKDAIPFGPFLCLGALITLMWGPRIMEWYWGWY